MSQTLQCLGVLIDYDDILTTVATKQRSEVFAYGLCTCYDYFHFFKVLFFFEELKELKGVRGS